MFSFSLLSFHFDLFSFFSNLDCLFVFAGLLFFTRFELFAILLLDFFSFLFESILGYCLFDSNLSSQQLCIVEFINSLFHLLLCRKMNITNSDTFVSLTTFNNSDWNDFTNCWEVIPKLLLLDIMWQVTNEYWWLSISIFLFAWCHSQCKLFELSTIFFTCFLYGLLFLKSYISVHNVSTFNILLQQVTGFSSHFVGFNWNWAEPNFLHFSIFWKESFEFIMFSFKVNITNKDSGLRTIFLNNLLRFILIISLLLFDNFFYNRLW